MSIRKFAPEGLDITLATAADRRYMDLNCHIGLWSKHLANKLGATIVNDAGHVLSLGFNGHPQDVDDGDPRNWTKPERYIHSVHAEANTLLNARLNGVPVEKATMHVLRFPCSGKIAACNEDGCSQKIIAAGISTVVVYSPPEDADHQLTDNFRRSLHLLVEHGVAIRWHDPGDAIYYPRMRPRPDTLPVPSRSVNWPARFLDLACYIAGWEAEGVGEVVVRRPWQGDALAAADPGLSDRLGKIVRTLECRSPRRGGGALEALRATGLAAKDCTMFLSAGCGAARLDDIAAAGIRHLVLPGNMPSQEEIRKNAEARGMTFSAIAPDLQAAPARAGQIAPQ